MFGHLQVYSGYSFQESTLLVNDIIQQAKITGMGALALTDHCNMHGMIEFYKGCLAADIKPIIGLEALIEIEHESYPFIVLALDTSGYYAVSRISTMNCTRQVVTIEDVAKEKEHIVVLTPGSEGVIERLIAKDLNQTAIKYLSLFNDLFDGHFYINLHDHHLEMQKRVNEKLINFAKMLNIKVVCSNEVRYLNKGDAYALELLKASKNETKLPMDFTVVSDELYFKDEAEMRKLFDSSIIEETERLIDSLNCEIPLGKWNLPVYPVPNHGSSYEYLKQLCVTGLKKRFKNSKVPAVYIERLKKEIEIIHSMKFDDYFLIVWDYVQYAKRNGIVVGPGRGSAAGSLVSYVLGITNIDPLKFDLLFERFLNPERVSMPDIDCDFQDNRRDEVIQYVISKYGQEHVTGIIAFNTYGPRVAIKDLGKVLNIPLVKLERLSGMVPTSNRDKKTAFEMYHESAGFYTTVNQDPGFSKIINAVFLVERLPRNISQHAAGVILSNSMIYNLVPVVIGASDSLLIQYAKDYIDDVGLLKMDFLGISNLTTIDYILKMIEKNHGIKINLNNINFQDKKIYDMIAKGDTFGIFQLETEGMKNLMVRMQVDCFDDLVAANALFRPGPMDNIPSYIARKYKKEPIQSLDPSIDHILSSTYGIIIYQEQIMQIAVTFASFTLGKADVLRKAVSKKGTSLMLSMKDEFIAGAVKNGHTKEKAIEIFELIEKFANYGFNKSHSVAYAVIAYQMAYLKAYYPLEFFAALLSAEAGSTNSKLSLIQEGRKYGVSLLPPSINRSTNRFEVENGNIRYALTAIKNVGSSAYLEIENVKPFKDIYDFFIKISKSRISDRVISSLADAGAFDEFGLERAMIKENIEELRSYASLYNELGIEDKPILKIAHDLRYEKLELEKEVLGIYVSKHPLVLYKERYKGNLVDVHNYNHFVNQKIVSILCLSRVKTIRDRKGKDMCFLSFYDETAKVDAVMFNQQYEQYSKELLRNQVYLVEGKITLKNNECSLTVNRIKLISGEKK